MDFWKVQKYNLIWIPSIWFQLQSLSLIDVVSVVSCRMGVYEEKKETCGTICLKYLLFTFNFLFWVSLHPGASEPLASVSSRPLVFHRGGSNSTKLRWSEGRRCLWNQAGCSRGRVMCQQSFPVVFARSLEICEHEKEKKQTWPDSGTISSFNQAVVTNLQPQTVFKKQLQFFN